MREISGKELLNSTITPSKLNFSGFTPVNPTDPLTKSYFEQYSNWKGECRISTVSNISSILTANAITIQNACDTISASTITLFPGDRILVNAQTNTTENGIWIWDGSNFTRDTNFNTTNKILSASLVWVRTGDLYEKQFFWAEIPTGFSLGSSSINWVRLINNVQFFSVSTNIQLTSLTTARKGDFCFVGTTPPFNTYILADDDFTVLSNWSLIGAGGGGGPVIISTPTDGQYGTSSSITGLVPGDRIEDALDKIDSFLELIVPEKGDLLIGTNLVNSLTTYQGILPTGLNAAWYTVSTSGNTVDVIPNTGYTLSTPTISTTFRTGKNGNNPTRGVLTSILNGSTDLTLSLTSGNPPLNSTNAGGTLNWLNVTTYNNIWSISSASLVYTDASEGARRHAISHTEAGTSNESIMYYDDTSSLITFTSIPTLSENTPVFKLLSGLSYYGLNSTFDLTYTVSSGIFQKTYHPTAVSTYSGQGFTTANINPTSIPAYTDDFPVNQTIQLNVANQSSGFSLLNVNVIARKSNSFSISANAIGIKRLCTYGTVSTNTSEFFFDEAKRLLVNNTTTYISTLYNSSVFNPSLDAQVRNGSLQYPVSGDYSPTVITAGDKEYQRMFIVGVRSNGTINLGNLLASDVSPLGTGDVNILLRLDGATNYAMTSGVIFDLGQSFGINNGNGNGDTRTNSIGGKDGSTTAGNILGFSLGTFSTALSSNQFRLIVIFRNTNKTINQLVFV